MVEVGDNCGWSSEEEELNYGGSLGVQGVVSGGAIRSATLVEQQMQQN